MDRESNAISQNNHSFSKRIIAPFATFIAMFVGAGFISGGIVHLGEGFNWWDITLLSMGIILFVIGSYIQESIYNKKNLKEEGAVLFLLYSLLLSIGIGMASGGTQHFVDTPRYSVFLIPIGLSLGLVAFILKQNIHLTKHQWFKLVPATIISAFILGSGLSILARSVPETWKHGSHVHGSSSHVENSVDVNTPVETQDASSASLSRPTLSDDVQLLKQKEVHDDGHDH